MYLLEPATRSVTSLAFGLVGVWMAHTFYRSPKSRFKIWAAWIAGFSYCAAAALLVERYLPSVVSTHEHISNLVGFGAVFVYLYLFTDVPAAQRVFTYLLIDNSLYILVILARTGALFLAGPLALSHDLLFLVFFFLLTACFLLSLERWLKAVILRELSAAQGHLTILAVYACVTYLAMLALIDPWAPVGRPSVGGTFALLMLCCAVICGYVLAFYVMNATRRARSSALEATQLTFQLSLSQRYYQALMEGIEQERGLRHDFIHHLRVMESMCAQGHTEELRRYLIGLRGHSEAAAPARYCACYAANVLFDHFARQAKELGIAFSCDAVIPEWDARESPKLCIVLGNLLQNALEGCQRLAVESERTLQLLARVVDGNLTIEVENSFDGVVQSQGGELLTRKEEAGHGLGLSSVRGVAESCHGFLSVRQDGRRFIARVVLRLPEGIEREHQI